MRPVPRQLYGGPNPVILGRKFCVGCGRWRLAIEFHASSRNPDGTATRLQARCKTCMRIVCRISHGMTAIGRPYEPKRPAMTHEQQLARVRELYHRKKLDPEWMERRREYDRIYREVKRRAAGAKERPHRRSVVDRPEMLFFEREPLVHQLRRVIDQLGQQTFAKTAGVQPRALYRLLSGESARVRIDLADKLALAMGSSLAVIYGDAEPLRGKEQP